MKYSRTALGLLNAQYRSVLRKCFLINMGLFAITAIATPAKAADTWTGAITETDAFMDNLAATSGGAWDRDDGVVTGWGVDQILGVMQNAATKTDAAVALVNDGTKGNEALSTKVSTLQSDLNTAEGKISTLETSVATKANQSDLNTLNSTVSTIQSNITNLQTNKADATTVTSLAGRVSTLEGAGYQTASQVTGAINTALANGGDAYQTASQVSSTVNGALASYSTTTAMNTAITDAVNGLDATVSQTASAANPLNLSITETNGVITAISGSIADDTYDAYGAASGVQTAITSGTITAAKATADADGNNISTTYAKSASLSTVATSGVASDVSYSNTSSGLTATNVQAAIDEVATMAGTGADKDLSNITDDGKNVIKGLADGQIATLDAEVSQTAAAANGQLALSITEVDGKITAISGSIAANTYDAYGAAAAVENKLDDGAAGYDIDAKTLKVQGADVLTASSALNGANITDGTITLEKIASSAIQGAADPVTYTGTKLTTQGYVDETKASILAGTGYSGSGLETAVTSTVTANAADGTYSSSGTYAANTIGKAIQTAQTDITALQTATTFTADGNYYAQTDTVANAIKKVDTQVKTNTGNIATNTSDIATINTKLGAVENLFSTGSSPIGRGDSVAAILSSVDTELDAATTKNTAQDTKLSGLATAIGGTYDSTTNVFTKNTYGTTLYTVNDAQSLTTAIGALDNALGSVATAKSAVAGASAATNLSDVVAQLSDNLTNGTVNAEFANTIVDSLKIDGTSYGITATGDANMHSLDIGTTGKGFDASGNAKTGTLTIGTANAITGTSTSLNINGNDLTNVKDLTTTGNATIGGGLSVTGASSLHNTSVNGTMTLTDGTVANTFTMNAKSFTVDSAPAKGVELSGSMFANGGVFASTNGFSVVSPVSGTPDTYTTVFDIDDKGNITSDMLKTDGTTNNTVTLGKDTNTKNILNGSLQFGTATGTPTVNAIDDGTTAATSAGTNNATTMATLASVLKSAENGDYTVGSSAKNITEATPSSGKTTLHTAIDTLDNEIGADSDYGTGTLNNGVVGTNSVKANIAAINDKLGNIPSTAVNGYDMTATGATLVGAVNKLDTNMEDVLGGIYKSDGTYDASQLAANGFSAAVAPATANLTQSLKDYAVNVETATGGTFSGATWTGSIDGKVDDGTSTLVDRTVAYGTISDNNIMDVVDQLYANVGNTAITGVNRAATLVTATTAGTKTVNANIDALDAAIGNLDYTGGSINYALANGSTTDGIKTIVANIGAATTAANGNITKSKSVNANLDQLDTAIGDRSNIGSKNAAINTGTATDVATGMKAAGDAIGDMNFAGSHYVAGNNDLSGAVRSLDSNLYRVESDLRDLRRDFRRGMASMSAMSALVPNPRAHGNTSLAIGTGAYDGHTAAAIGGFHYLTDNIMLNAGVAWGNSSDAAYRMGVTFSW